MRLMQIYASFANFLNKKMSEKELSFCHKLTFSLQSDGVNLWYFKLRQFDVTEIIIWNIERLRHRVSNIKGLESRSLWQKLSSFLTIQWLGGLHLYIALVDTKNVFRAIFLNVLVENFLLGSRQWIFESGPG